MGKLKLGHYPRPPSFAFPRPFVLALFEAPNAALESVVAAKRFPHPPPLLGPISIATIFN